MTRLRDKPGFADPDAFYEKLVDAHRDLDAAASAKLNAKLVLLLANHIGDLELVEEALAAASSADTGPQRL
jgi:hypothetical protein